MMLEFRNGVYDAIGGRFMIVVCVAQHAVPPILKCDPGNCIFFSCMHCHSDEREREY